MNNEKPGRYRPEPRKAPSRKSIDERLEISKRRVNEPLRLNRYIAQAGVAARRKADELIEAGKVKINGKVVTELGTKVAPGDEVEVAGTVISPRSYVYVLMNKPADAITTNSDEKGRKTVLDIIRLDEKEKAGLFAVGRLDRNTVGVLLLTNDGELAHRLMHPRYDVVKIYRARTTEPVKPHQLETLKRGVTLEDGPAVPDRLEYLNPKDFSDIGIQIHEGRNRQVHRMFEAIGHTLESLERVSYAGLTTEGVRRGHWRKLYPHEIKRLRALVKLK